jgi:hypothetical protein
MIADHDKDGDKMIDILEYAEHHQADPTGEHHCSNKQLLDVDNGSKDITKCSSKAIDCWEDDTGKGDKYPAKNDKCKNMHESCGVFTWLQPVPDKDGKKQADKEIEYKNCILSKYCDKTKADGWNYKTYSIKGDKFECPDGIKKDDADEKAAKAKDAR